MSSKFKKWYVILGLTLGGLAVCGLLLMAGGVAGGLAGYWAAYRGGAIGWLGPWQQWRLEIPRQQEAPEIIPQEPQPWQMPPEMTFELPAGQLQGALVVELDSDGSAERAGLETGDIIIAVDDRAMGQDQDLRALIAVHDPQDEVVLTVVRPGEDPELLSLEVTLGSDTDEEGQEVAHLGLTYRNVSSGLMSLGRVPWSGGRGRKD